MLAASGKLEAAQMSSACPDEPTSSPEMQKPWPVMLRCFSRESMTTVNKVGERTDSYFTTQFTGKHSEDLLSSLTTFTELAYQFFTRHQH